MKSQYNLETFLLILHRVVLSYVVYCNIDPVAAFDVAHDPAVALETLVSLGFERVLTSGCDSSALEGLPVIKRIIDQVCINQTVCVQTYGSGMATELSFSVTVGQHLMYLPIFLT